MPAEQHIQQTIRLACSRGPVRLWRNNVGTAWTGKSEQVTRLNAFAIGRTLKPGDVVVRQARPFHAGLCPGSADLVGYRTITVTPEMVGQQLAVFAAVEVKGERGRPTAEQTAWLEHVRAAGGIAGIARSVDDTQHLLGL